MREENNYGNTRDFNNGLDCNGREENWSKRGKEENLWKNIENDILMNNDWRRKKKKISIPMIS